MSQTVRAGILGGGQLALMLAQAAEDLGIEVAVLSLGADDPAAAAARHVLGDPNELNDVVRFAESCDVLTFENEFVPAAVLRRLGEMGPERVRPAPHALFQLQNKIRQKKLLENLRIPTSPWSGPEAGERADDWARRAWLDFEKDGGPVLKWAELGYDGKGTCLAYSLEEAVGFAREGFTQGREIFSEARVPFVRELAVIACRSVMGEFRAWPLVESTQVSGTCYSVRGPAQALGVRAGLEELAHDYARRIGDALNFVGTFAVEMFETPDGQLLVNELAPRVHNTGHYTADASKTSQFTNHWRALLGLSLGDTASSAGGFAMINLLGPKGVTPRSGPLPLPQVPLLDGGQAVLHWYGKTEVRPGRKMGHVNLAVAAIADLDGALEDLLACERRWAADIERGSES